ncbi:putative FAD-linked oxidoreductase [Thalassovita gelatinovora]|uniref:Putative FAD-linked oxidoreductase n=1 Tax=Thalassovita gelatinovora TaxID=53501 RepID=A0A0P1FT07_THAGE|nr:FAD-binding oxidoreductase [Thalassovita gelatinovora]QIZ79178.1 FAD-binding oxidoreductase [Thalassovita gelatinovora]CUH63648.1 putative FAD-linked oxidoreductase [Thalassovita gelatinovora]SER00939.1 FAD/FMN-containing dehydrogenase [Thalassovita gelatinovora]
MADLIALRDALSGFDLDENPNSVQRKSRDFYWYSPVLMEQLKDVCADLVVTPKDEAELIEILKICYAHDVPVTTRGAGTGNYGQAMPLEGGVVLHMKHMTAIKSIADGVLVAEAGAIIKNLEIAAREAGTELRLFPSTTAMATLGGFIAGGSSGIGAIRWGGLRTPGNILRVRLVTMEAEPRIIELTGDDVFKAAHAYGVNGVITEIEIPVDPAVDWCDVLIGAPDFTTATKISFAIGEAETITKRMVSTFEAEIPAAYFNRYTEFTVPGEAVVAVIVARADLEKLETLIDETGGSMRFRADRDIGDRRLPAVYEYCWNHTTLRALKVDPSLSYLQMMLPHDDLYSAIARVKADFGDELILHFEMTIFAGKVTAMCMPVLRYTSAERLEQLIVTLEHDYGVIVFNPHRVTLEEGGMKKTDPSQLQFKRETDPKGLLNPGKMIAWTDPDWRPEPGRAYLFNR